MDTHQLFNLVHIRIRMVLEWGREVVLFKKKKRMV